MTSYKFDLLVIGSGIAGLSLALKVAESGAQVGIITREKKPEISNTYYAQGGIVFCKKDDDTFVKDVLCAGSYTSNEDAINLVKSRSFDILNEVLLEKTGTDFCRTEKGEFRFTREAAHSIERIIYKGDYTGKAIQVSLLNYLCDRNRFPNVSLLTGHTAIDLLTPEHHGVKIQQRYESDQVVGAYVLNQETGNVIKILSKKTVLATGGIASLYLHHSNSEGARGDGHAMAKRAGAILTNMEFIQFHPTTFYTRSGHRRFLISEAVRGEGGILINSEGNAFMEKYHVDRELAPRDVVARAIVEETIRTRHECVYLDITHKNRDELEKRFPVIFKHCLENDVDMSSTPIPVVPAAHYTCGGVKTDLNGNTNLKNLYAVGEVACNGFHGANRLASTALLEGLTFGYVAAENILKDLNESVYYSSREIKDWENVGFGETDLALIHQDWLTLRQTMWNYAGLIRSTDRLIRAQAMFRELFEEVHNFYRHVKLKDELIGLRNGIEIGLLVISASSRNRDSVGCFYRK